MDNYIWEDNFSSPYISQLLLYPESESEYLAEASRDKLNGLILTDSKSKDTRISILKRNGISFVGHGSFYKENEQKKAKELLKKGKCMESLNSERVDDRAGAPGHRSIVERHRERR